MITDLESIFVEGQPWPPREEAARNASYAENRLLRANDFNAVWGDRLRYLREDGKKELKLYAGYFWLAVKKTSDMCLGEPPVFSLPKTGEAVNPQQGALDDFLKASNFQQTLKEVLMDQDPLGDGVFKVWRTESGEVKIQANSPDNWFPVVVPGSIREFQYHILVTQFKKVLNKDDGERTFLKVEIHSKTAIEHRVYELNVSSVEGINTSIGRKLDLGLFDEFKGLKEIQDNPTGEFLVIPVHNIRTSDSVYGIGSFSPDLKTLMQGYIERLSQRQRVLNKASDPDLVAPMGYTTKNPVTGKQEYRAGGRVLQYRHDPGMSAPDFHFLEPNLTGLAQANEELADIRARILELLELPSVLLAQEAPMGVASGVALQLLCQPIIAKVGRIRAELDIAAKHALQLALKLQGIEVTVEIQWNDGLPQISSELAQEFYTLSGSPAFQGEMGLVWLMKNKLGISEKDALKIAADPSRGGGLGLKI